LQHPLAPPKILPIFPHRRDVVAEQVVVGAVLERRGRQDVIPSRPKVLRLAEGGSDHQAAIMRPRLVGHTSVKVIILFMLSNQFFGFDRPPGLSYLKDKTSGKVSIDS